LALFMSGSSEKKATAMPSSLPSSPAGETPEAADSLLSKSETSTSGLNDRWLVPGVCIFLAAITFAVFGQTLGYEFVNYDDNIHVYDNLAVKSGLTLKSIAWAFKFSQSDYWHPLDFLSHMLDCQLYGLAPAGHHLTNVLLHATVAILLFLVLRQMTGALWRSAFVAAIFAIHPLRVESVAWVSERKDILHGVFFMLTLWAYVRYVRHSWSLARYLAVVLLFSFGLMSKPTLMTLPFVLLLLDYWPLKRFAPLAATGAAGGTKPSGWRIYRPLVIRIMIEKLPLFLLSAAACVQAAVGNSMAFGSNKSLPMSLRISNAMVSYVTYIWQMVWPVKLAVLYPFPVKGLPFVEVIGAVILLVFISTVLFLLRQRHPCYLVGWLWYLGMLVPMIGFIQAGSIAHADRYTYLPQIGLYLLLTWAAADWCAGWRHHRVVLSGGATVILMVLIFCARVQTSYWRNSELLWTHALACTSDNYIAHNNLGNALPQKEKMEEAIIQYQTALEIKPDFAEACYSLGNALSQKGRMDEAIAYYQTALQINPGYAEAHNNLGNALLQKGVVEEAMAQYQLALRIKPDYAEARYNLGIALLQKGDVDAAITQYQQALQIIPDNAQVHVHLGNALLKKSRVDEAISQYQQALRITPNNAEAHNNLGYALLKTGNANEAMVHFQKALQIKPDALNVLNNLAWLLATCPDARIRNGVQAVQYAGRACELTHYGAAPLIATLAAAYAEAGRYDDAIEAAQKACALATTAGDPDLLEKTQRQLALYRTHQPYHETVEKIISGAPSHPDNPARP
jgi:tetratricopeptide (TPR) repeat protein